MAIQDYNNNGCNTNWEFNNPSPVFKHKALTIKPSLPTIFIVYKGEKQLERSNYLGNVLATVSDRKAMVGVNNVKSYYISEYQSFGMYYAFGAPLPGRGYTVPLAPGIIDKAYRYGFNGQEKDNHVEGDGNSYTAEYWQYDSRLGRRWNQDPIYKEWESPYASIHNSPIYLIDLLGDDPMPNYIKRAYNRAQELSDEGYFVAIQISNEGNISLILFKKVYEYTKVSLPKGKYGVKYSKKSSYALIGNENLRRRWYDKVVDFANGVDDYTRKMKGNSKFRFGIILKNAPGSNDDVAKLANDGSYLEYEWDDFSWMSKIKNKPLNPIPKLDDQKLKDLAKKIIDNDKYYNTKNPGEVKDPGKVRGVIRLNKMGTKYKDTLFNNKDDLNNYNKNNVNRPIYEVVGPNK